MFEFIEFLIFSRGFYYLLGVGVVALVLFTTAAKGPGSRCPRCRRINRPMARYCAQCGQPLGKS